MTTYNEAVQCAAEAVKAVQLAKLRRDSAAALLVSVVCDRGAPSQCIVALAGALTQAAQRGADTLSMETAHMLSPPKPERPAYDEPEPIVAHTVGAPMPVAERLARMPVPEKIGRPNLDGRYLRSKERNWIEAQDTYQRAQADGTESMTLFRQVVTADAQHRRALYAPGNPRRQYRPKEDLIRDYRRIMHGRLAIKPLRVRGIRKWFRDAVLTREEQIAVRAMGEMRDQLRGSLSRFADQAYDMALASLRTKDGEIRVRGPQGDDPEAQADADAAAYGFGAVSSVLAARHLRHRALKTGSGWSGRTTALSEASGYAAPNVVDGPTLLRWLADCKDATGMVARMGNVTADHARRAIKAALKGTDTYGFRVE